MNEGSFDERIRIVPAVLADAVLKDPAERLPDVLGRFSVTFVGNTAQKCEDIGGINGIGGMAADLGIYAIGEPAAGVLPPCRRLVRSEFRII